MDWDNEILYCGYRWDAVVKLYHVRHRVYQPTLGRWMQRDPGPGAASQYADGMNLYQYVGSNPVSFLDPLGLWKVEREGIPTAKAETTAEIAAGSITIWTIEKLAVDIGLNADEFHKWLQGPAQVMTLRGHIAFGGLKKEDGICPDQTFYIPNSVLAYWGGELGGFGKWWVMWGTDVNTLKTRGFNVPEHEGWTAGALQTKIQAGTKAKQLHGILFWGHGYIGGVLTDSSQKGNAQYESDYGSWNPAYKLGLGVLFACHTQSGRGQFSGGAIFWGKTGTLVPHGLRLFGPTVSTLVPPGAQRTKK